MWDVVLSDGQVFSAAEGHVPLDRGLALPCWCFFDTFVTTAKVKPESLCFTVSFYQPSAVEAKKSKSQSPQGVREQQLVS